MLIFKRYISPMIISSILYFLVWAVFGSGNAFALGGMVFSFAIAYLIRVCDDICDYEKDEKSGKVLLSKKVLKVLCRILSVITALGAVVFGKYVILLPLALVLAQFTINERYREYIKPLFLPSAVLGLAVSYYRVSIAIYPICFVLVVMDVIIILIKRRRKTDDIGE